MSMPSGGVLPTEFGPKVYPSFDRVDLEAAGELCEALDVAGIPRLHPQNIDGPAPRT